MTDQNLIFHSDLLQILKYDWYSLAERVEVYTSHKIETCHEDTEIMKYIVAFIALIAPGSVFAQSCADWSSYDFWQVATVNVVESCLRSIPVDATPDFDKTALHYAAIEATDPAVVQALVDAGADLEARDVAGSAPIHYAAQNQNVEIIKVLIAAGADITATQEGGATPLHLAALHSTPAVMTELMNSGADVHTTDWDGKTAFDYAKRGQTDEALNNYLILKNAM